MHETQRTGNSSSWMRAATIRRSATINPASELVVPHSGQRTGSPAQPRRSYPHSRQTRSSQSAVARSLASAVRLREKIVLKKVNIGQSLRDWTCSKLRQSKNETVHFFLSLPVSTVHKSDRFVAPFESPVMNHDRPSSLEKMLLSSSCC